MRQPALNLILYLVGVCSGCCALRNRRNFETFKVVACRMALVPFQFQIHLWNWRIAKRFGTACSRDGSGNGRLRTETLGKFSKFRKKSGILAPLKPPLRLLLYAVERPFLITHFIRNSRFSDKVQGARYQKMLSVMLLQSRRTTAAYSTQ